MRGGVGVGFVIRVMFLLCGQIEVSQGCQNRGGLTFQIRSQDDAIWRGLVPVDREVCLLCAMKGRKGVSALVGVWVAEGVVKNKYDFCGSQSRFSFGENSPIKITVYVCVCVCFFFPITFTRLVLKLRQQIFIIEIKRGKLSHTRSLKYYIVLRGFTHSWDTITLMVDALYTYMVF